VCVNQWCSLTETITNHHHHQYDVSHADIISESQRDKLTTQRKVLNLVLEYIVIEYNILEYSTY
jgi:hypothetical protein